MSGRKSNILFYVRLMIILLSIYLAFVIVALNIPNLVVLLNMVFKIFLIRYKNYSIFFRVFSDYLSRPQ